MYAETLCQRLHITKAAYKKAADRFCENCVIERKVHKDDQDARSHFRIWLEKNFNGNVQNDIVNDGKRPKLGPGEFIDGSGRRTYGSGKYEVPMDAPARPSEKWWWNSQLNQWTM